MARWESAAGRWVGTGEWTCSILGPGGGGGGNSSCVIINQMHIRVIARKGCLNTNSAHFNSDNLIVVERHLQGPPKYF